MAKKGYKQTEEWKRKMRERMEIKFTDANKKEIIRLFNDNCTNILLFSIFTIEKLKIQSNHQPIINQSSTNQHSQ